MITNKSGYRIVQDLQNKDDHEKIYLEVSKAVRIKLNCISFFTILH